MQLTDMLSGIKTNPYRNSLPPPSNSTKSCDIDFQQFATSLYSFFTLEIVYPLLRHFFYITERGKEGNRLYYYMLDQWLQHQETSIDNLQKKDGLKLVTSSLPTPPFEAKCREETAINTRISSLVSVLRTRFVPKKTGMRLIIQHNGVAKLFSQSYITKRNMLLGLNHGNAQIVGRPRTIGEISPASCFDSQDPFFKAFGALLGDCDIQSLEEKEEEMLWNENIPASKRTGMGCYSSMKKKEGEKEYEGKSNCDQNQGKAPWIRRTLSKEEENIKNKVKWQTFELSQRMQYQVQDCFYILTHVRKANPQLFGASLFGITELYSRVLPFYKTLVNPKTGLYSFKKRRKHRFGVLTADIEGAFDHIQRTRLMGLLDSIIKHTFSVKRTNTSALKCVQIIPSTASGESQTESAFVTPRNPYFSANSCSFVKKIHTFSNSIYYT
eukprot:MONOS_7317.1-p1 / transcript=MONOS_7317.1 / gene=MONOS_7317 / organism=Monocercomonoides_exilis_PA203 / gene_product=unspecified product / transcript_product=unspecified product / location=Mono_scaffold00247:55271-57202(-) / protein_length=439 / sequence_SO=supercontig / SO=protein_coding / is_pseudo=false